MKKIIGFCSAIALLILLSSGIISDFIRFMLWLFTLQYASPDTSIAGGIIVRILTFAVSYSLVGLIFNVLGLFDGKIMSFAYFVISTLLGFVLAWVVWTIEKYILFIEIGMAVVFIIATGLWIFNSKIIKKRVNN